MNKQYLLCCDLDRTVLPNGKEPESPQARTWFRKLAERPEMLVAYVSGRHEHLLKQAIVDYALPVPQFAIGDVGSTLYRLVHGNWERDGAWERHIAPDWNGADHADLAALFVDLSQLRLQEDSKQNRFKLSYYAPADLDRDELLAEMQTRLQQRNVRASLIWSVDEQANTGLLDVLPAGATKLHAVRFLMQECAIAETDIVFAGDSGNDLPVLTSGLQAVLVRNAHPDVREEAQRVARLSGCANRLYLARGGFLGMNGNYAAGVLEGAAHFLPAVASWLGGRAASQ